MREGIHPEYQESKVVCSCGATFTTRSTKPELHVELCSSCHPFYTGKQKFVDTGGRVQRFADKFGNTAAQTVLDREAKQREARQKAAEEARAAAAAAKAEREAKAPLRPKAKAAAEPAAEETPVEETPEAAEETLAEETPAAEEAPAAEEPTEESGE